MFEDEFLCPSNFWFTLFPRHPSAVEERKPAA